MIIAGLLAGRWIPRQTERIIQRCVDDPLITAVFVLTPKDMFPGTCKDLLSGKKVRHINSWVGQDSHNKTGINRERLRSTIRDHVDFDPVRSENVKWIVIGDDDGLPAPDYFEKLIEIEYEDPVLLTGKTFNLDGARFYDICCFQVDHIPFCVPYDDWENPRWAKDLYCSGNQHVMNRAGFNLNVSYQDIPGEDPHYSWAFRKAGGKLVFRPELSMKLLKMHARGNLGFEPRLPK